MLLRFDPFRDLDRLFEAASGTPASGVHAPAGADGRVPPGDTLTSPSTSPASTGHDRPHRWSATSSPYGRAAPHPGTRARSGSSPSGRWGASSRQLMLGDNLGHDNISADFAERRS
jgi:hypothetical protein